MASNAFYIGLMSGTSTDGVDAVLADFTNPACPILGANVSLPMPETLRQEFLSLNLPGADELARAALAGNELATLYARAVHELLIQAGLDSTAITAIGAHGQTVRHAPHQGYSIQINAPALLAELTDIDVIADFRSRDIAARGQGAPLVPAFHQAIFSTDHPRAVLNLGGIANVTLLESGTPLRGFDTGPANVLLDMWCQDKTGKAYDEDGRWAASGVVHHDLLDALIVDEPWFALAPPKSTGRDHFHLGWVEARLRGDEAAADVQATLNALTARTVASALLATQPDTRRVIACGGGVHNPQLMAALAASLPDTRVESTAAHGLDPDHVEAMGFAWLARQTLLGLPGNLPSVTGAAGPRVLGGIYPA